jgi:hypothetical protein
VIKPTGTPPQSKLGIALDAMLTLERAQEQLPVVLDMAWVT